MRDYDLSSYVDGELSAEEERIVDEALRCEPDLLIGLAALHRERLLMAETLIEESIHSGQTQHNAEQESCASCSEPEPSAELLPNEEIFTAYVGGQLTKPQVQEVEDQIKSDPLFKKEFAEFCRHRYQLADVFNSEHSKPLPRTLHFPDNHIRPQPTQSNPKRSTSWMKIAAIFVVLGAGFWLVLQTLGPRHKGSPTQAISSAENNLKIESLIGEVALIRKTIEQPTSFGETRAEERLQAGSHIHLKDGDTIITGSGSAKVIYDDGTQLNVRSYSHVKFATSGRSKQISLESGLATADVTPQPSGQPLLIKTPQIQVKVLGTSLTLEASQDRTLLEMTEGAVTVKHLGSKDSADTKTGEWLTANNSGITFSGTEPRVVSFSFIDTKTKLPLPGLNPIMPGSVIKLGQIQGKELTIRANTVPKIMNQVTLGLKGPRGYPDIKQLENYYPYLLTHNKTDSHWVDAKVYLPMPKLIPGSYSIKAIAETPHNRKVSHTLRFDVRP